MPQITVDFSQVETYEALPPGEYPVVIDAIELRQSESSEHPYLNFTLVVPEGEFANRKLWFIGSLSPKALFRLKAVFDSFGLTDEQTVLDVDDATGVLLNPQLVGLPALAVVGNEVYQGQLRSRVNELIGAEGIAGGAAPATEGAPAAAATAAPAARRSPFAPKAGASGGRTFK
jgi:hypothetical protein